MRVSDQQDMMLQTTVESDPKRLCVLYQSEYLHDNGGLLEDFKQGMA